jgi:hypothetical protein
MNRILTLRLVASLVAMGALSGCAYYGWQNHWPYSDTTPQWDALPDWSDLRHWRVSYAGREPPPTPIEVIPDPPGNGYVWVTGHWRWENDDFQWVTGSWEKPPHKNEAWVPGRWGFDQYGWYYLNGHWQ